MDKSRTWSGAFDIDEDKIVKKILDALNAMDDTDVQQEIESSEGDDADAR